MLVMKISHLNERATSPYYEAIDLLSDLRKNRDRIAVVFNRMADDLPKGPPTNVDDVARSAVGDPPRDRSATPDTIVEVDGDSTVLLFTNSIYPTDLLNKARGYIYNHYAYDTQAENLLRKAVEDEFLQPTVRRKAQSLLSMMENGPTWFVNDVKGEPENRNHLICTMTHATSLIGIKLTAGKSGKDYENQAIHPELRHAEDPSTGFRFILRADISVRGNDGIPEWGGVKPLA